jgi:hypothetical protein
MSGPLASLMKITRNTRSSPSFQKICTRNLLSNSFPVSSLATEDKRENHWMYIDNLFCVHFYTLKQLKPQAANCGVWGWL